MCSIFVEAGYFCMVLGKEIDYGDFSLIFSFLFSLLILPHRIKRDCFVVFFIASLTAFIGLVFLIIAPFTELIVTGDSISYDMVSLGITSLNYAVLNSGNIIKFLFLLMYYTVCLTAIVVIDRKHKIVLLNKFNQVVKFFLLLGLIEIFFAYYLHSNVARCFVNYVLGDGKQFRGLIMRNSGYMLQGLCRESSHYLFALFVSSVALFWEWSVYKKYSTLLWFFVLAFISVLSSSMSVLLYFAGLMGIIFMYKLYVTICSNIKIISLFIKILLVIVIFSFFLFAISQSYTLDNSHVMQRIIDFPNIFSALLSDKNLYYVGEHYSSELVRFYSIISTINLLFYKPFFGFGIGTTICHGSSVQFITDVGLFGIVSWMYLHFFLGDKNLFFRFAIFYYIILNSFSSVYLIPFSSVASLVIFYYLSSLFSCKECIETNHLKKG